MKPIRHHLRNAFIPHAGNDFHPHLLRWPWVHAFGAILVVVKIAAIIVISFYSGRAHQASITPSAIIHLTNQARATQGLGSLAANAALSKAAQAKANDMIAHDYFAHVSPSKITPWYWFSQAGYRYTSAGENLAIDYVSSEDVVTAWMNSPSHRKNILQSKYKDIGVAVVTGDINGATSVLVVQLFGAPTKIATKIAPTPVKQAPNPSVTKSTLTKSPIVLGQQTSPKKNIQAPTISSPAEQSIVHGTPTLVGVAEAGSTLTIREGQQLIESQAVPSNGVFAITLPTSFADGPHTFIVTSAARGIQASSTLTFRIDQKAPELVAADTMMLPSIVGAGIYDVVVAGSADTTAVTIKNSGTVIPLQQQGNHFVGQVAYRPSVTPVVQVELQDQAKNTTAVPLYDPSLSTTGVIAHHGPSYSALQTIFFSRMFLTLFLLLMIVGMAFNVGMTWHRQHHPALLPTMLLVYLSGALLFL